MAYKWLAFCAMFLGCSVGNCQYSTGTAIIAINTGKFAVVAADSMVRYATTTTNDACKIRLAKPTSIVVIDGIGNKGTIDFASIGARVLARSNVTDMGGLKKATAEWTKYMVDFFTQEITTNEQLMLKFAEDNEKSQAIFLTIDKDGQILAALVGIQIAKDNSGKATVTPTTPSYNTAPQNGINNVITVELGSLEYWKLKARSEAGDKAAVNLGRSMYNGKTVAEIVEAAKKFIEGAEKDFPAKVGRPVDEILLDANGPQWMYVKKGCDVDVVKEPK